MKLYTEDYLIGLATGIVLHSEIGESIDKKTAYEFSVKPMSEYLFKRIGFHSPIKLICEWTVPDGEERHEANTDRGTETWYEPKTRTDRHEFPINKILPENILVRMIEKELIPKLVAVKWEE